MTRYGYRCGRCHSWAFVDADALPEELVRYGARGALPAIACPYCGTEKGLAYVGRVERGAIIDTAEGSPCDSACTSAKGTHWHRQKTALVQGLAR